MCGARGSIGTLGCLREALRMPGIDCGEARLPIAPLPDSQRVCFREELAAVDFEELAVM